MRARAANSAIASWFQWLINPYVCAKRNRPTGSANSRQTSHQHTTPEMLSKIRKSLQVPSGARVQVLSDLHLEVGSQYATYICPVAAPFLLLAGDIGRLIDYEGYLEFLAAQVSRFDKVFLILGNETTNSTAWNTKLELTRRSDSPGSRHCNKNWSSRIGRAGTIRLKPYDSRLHPLVVRPRDSNGDCRVQD